MSIVDLDLTETIHRATQYLATAAINYMDHKEDDSHTNLDWDAQRKSFITRPLGDKDIYLALNLVNFRLEFVRNGMVLASKPLTGSRHQEMVDWLMEVFRDLSFDEPYRFGMHYELPYQNLTPEYMYESPDENELMEHSGLRDQAYKVIKSVVKKFDDHQNVRTWPHHFDTASLINLGGKYTIGLGLAIPDDMVNTFYYYVAAWKGDKAMDVSSFPDLKSGRWINDNWKGAVLEATMKEDVEVKKFFNEAIDFLK